MKKIFTLTLVLVALGFQVKAQCPANDSTAMGSGTANDVFYSFANHESRLRMQDATLMTNNMREFEYRGSVAG